MSAAKTAGEKPTAAKTVGAKSATVKSASSQPSTPQKSGAKMPAAQSGAIKHLSDDSLMREIFHLKAVMERRARKSEGTKGTSSVLALLAGHEIAIAEGFTSRLMTQTELAQRLGIRPQSVGVLVVQLEEKGYLRRIPRDNDKRAFLLELTDAGRENAQEVREQQRLFAEDAFAPLTQKEKDQLTSIVTKLNAFFS